MNSNEQQGTVLGHRAHAVTFSYNQNLWV